MNSITSEALANRFDFSEAQHRLYATWEENGYFRSEPDPDREPFTIVIPPPNVTGALHLGHALNNTLQDVLIRFKRMSGKNALWMPGTDPRRYCHASCRGKTLARRGRKNASRLGTGKTRGSHLVMERSV